MLLRQVFTTPPGPRPRRVPRRHATAPSIGAHHATTPLPSRRRRCSIASHVAVGLGAQLGYSSRRLKPFQPPPSSATPPRLLGFQPPSAAAASVGSRLRRCLTDLATMPAMHRAGLDCLPPSLYSSAATSSSRSPQSPRWQRHRAITASPPRHRRGRSEPLATGPLLSPSAHQHTA